MNRRNWWDFLEIWELEYAKLCQRKIRALDDERLVWAAKRQKIVNRGSDRCKSNPDWKPTKHEVER
jgi:hypothetical protein